MGVGYVRKMTHDSNRWALKSCGSITPPSTAILLSHSSDLFIHFLPISWPALGQPEQLLQTVLEISNKRLEF